MSSATRNTYLEQVVQEKVQLEEDLKARKSAPQAAMAMHRRGGLAGFVAPEPSGPAADVRVTGFWRWKNVIVPPNAYVVHTRRGRPHPLHLGLGVSFRFDPVTDAFLVVPAAMQTIIIQANCVCRERQGVLVQAYVQWLIDDFETAYQRLDLSDRDEPMRVVNVQLREQAEAAIKDKVATMSIDDVLADKQPIIAELTTRLRHVAEGSGDRHRGLGLKIVTVQIKEAVVCSPTVWETLQRPFRSERAREARLAELANQSVVAERETEALREKARLEIETKTERERLEIQAATEVEDRRREAEVRRARLEAEALEERIAHEKNKLAMESELEKLRLEVELADAEARAASRHRIETEATELLAARRRIDNERSREAVQMAWVQSLPEVVSALPRVDRLENVTIGDGALRAIASTIGELVETRKNGS